MFFRREDTTEEDPAPETEEGKTVGVQLVERGEEEEERCKCEEKGCRENDAGFGQRCHFVGVC